MPMKTIAPWVMTASVAICTLLGILHLIYTFYGPKLLPRDPELQVRMQQVSPIITRRTTMWKGWLGFNASHSVGLIMFGAVYGYLALLHDEFLFRSAYLLSLGMMLLLSYVLITQKYFFRAPLRSILISTVLYGLAIFLRWA